MNLGEAEHEFRRDVFDTVAAKYLYSREDIARWYNEAEFEAAIRAKLIFDDSSPATELSLSAGDRLVELDPLIHEIERAWLVDSSGAVHYLIATDRAELDRTDFRWRELTGRPTRLVHDDKAVTFNRIADADYSLRLEVFRGPRNVMVQRYDRPEIASEHHRGLLDWVKFRALSVPDLDSEAPGLAREHLAAFEARFGRRPEAGYARRNQANRPHRIKAWA